MVFGYSKKRQLRCDLCFRFLRATTVGPTSSEYISAMPFTYQAEQAVDRMQSRASRSYRATTVEPSNLYTRSYNTGNGYSAFDYKVRIVIKMALSYVTMKLRISMESTGPVTC